MSVEKCRWIKEQNYGDAILNKKLLSELYYFSISMHIILRTVVTYKDTI